MEESTQYTQLPDEFEVLYDIPIENLGLRSRTIQLLHECGVTSVGDCIAFHIHCLSAMINAAYEYRVAMDTEVRDKLKEHGYWAFYERLVQ